MSHIGCKSLSTSNDTITQVCNDMEEQWQELKETIIELRDNDGTLSQQEVCRFLANLMEVLEQQEKQNTH